MTTLSLPLAIPGGQDASLAIELCRDRFVEIPNGNPVTESDLLAVFVLSCERAPETGGDIHVIAAKVRMFDLGLGSRPPPLSELEHLGLYALAARELGGRASPTIERRVHAEGHDFAALLDGLAARMHKMYGFLCSIREKRRLACEDLGREISESLPEGLSLLPHQVEAVFLAKQAGWKYIFADQMGLGKTVELLACMALRGEDSFPAFIAAPKSMLETWRQEVEKWLSMLTPECVPLYGALNIREHLASKPRSRMVFIGTYAQMRIHVGDLQMMKLGTFIVDESQCLANPDSSQSQAALTVSTTARSVLLATGTLMPNGRYAEAYCQMRVVNRSVFMYLDGVRGSQDWYAFARHFCDPQILRLGTHSSGRHKGKPKIRTEYKGRSNDVEFGMLLSRMQIRRTKAEVFGSDGLPPKSRHAIYVHVSDRERMKFSKIRDQISFQIRERAAKLRTELIDKGVPLEKVSSDVKRVLSSEILTAMTPLRVALGEAKISWTIERVVELLEEGHEVLVFCWYNEVAEKLSRAMGKKGIAHLVATGAMSGSARNEAVEAMKRGEQRVGILTSAFKEGLTLVSYDRLIMHERWWRSSDEMQAEDRIHRLGQKREVDIAFPVVKGTYDEVIGELHVWKEQGSAQVTGSAEVRTYEWLLGGEGGADAEV